ncbi:MAG: SAM-dependent methyltransferase, partial [Lachnospiraceae bacterium]|nr:SAM-dependent methyltransferase [Lachnospiraceae bacterium]
MADDMKEYLRETVIPKLMEALQVYNKEDIEDTIIAMYTDSALCPGGNKIKEIVTQFSIDLDMEAVIYIFEALLEKENIIENGIVFTPEYIASFIVKNIFDNVSEWSEKLRIIDPGCGCGIFLITAIEYLKNRFHVRVKDIVLNNIYG